MVLKNLLLIMVTLCGVFSATTAEARFLSQDPVQYNPNQHSTAMFNRYAYSFNNPVNLVDPDGRAPMSVMDRRYVAPVVGPKHAAAIQEIHDEIAQEMAEGMYDFFIADGVNAANSVMDGDFTDAAIAGGLALSKPAKIVEKVIPDKAWKTLREIRETGKPPKGHVGGREFKNREGNLPADGNYKEFDVDPKPTTGRRNAERVVVDQDTGRAYYTDDHYKSFTEFDD